MPVQGRSSISELNSMRMIGSLINPNDWERAQKLIVFAIKNHLSDQPYFEAPGAKFVPIMNRLQFTDRRPIIAGSTLAQPGWSDS
jgi:hypothetical protein